MKRMWINQPSKNQSLHHLHGTQVLAEQESGGMTRVYLLSGLTISQLIPSIVLSDGWPNCPPKPSNTRDFMISERVVKKNGHYSEYPPSSNYNIPTHGMKVKAGGLSEGFLVLSYPDGRETPPLNPNSFFPEDFLAPTCKEKDTTLKIVFPTKDEEKKQFIREYVMARANCSPQNLSGIGAAEEAERVWERFLK